MLILSSESMADFVNKADFVSTISGYDRDMLEQLATIQTEISEKEEALNENKDKLTTLQDELVAKQQELNNKVAETSAALTNSKTQLADAEAAALEKEKSLKGAADGQTTESSSGSTKTYDNSDRTGAATAGDTSNVAALAAIIECEAGGESYTGKVAVGAVVLNRVSSSRYPNTVMGVITQKSQFAPVASGRFAIVLARGANGSCVKAAKDALAGSDPTGGCLSFRATWSGNYDGLVIGNQVFF
jgi:spore germination cell wall hydrolase CwlJ-like protein